jgi:hypothetical protein
MENRPGRREDSSMSETGSEDDPLGRLAEEFLECYRRGEHPAPTEYARLHPELAERIRDLFPALAMLEEVRPGSGAAAAALPWASSTKPSRSHSAAAWR